MILFATSQAKKANEAVPYCPVLFERIAEFTRNLA